jgi:hypothetical protein
VHQNQKSSWAAVQCELPSEPAGEDIFFIESFYLATNYALPKDQVGFHGLLSLTGKFNSILLVTSDHDTILDMC